MKTIHFPYLSKKASNGWNFSIPLTNRSNKDTVVSVSYYYDSGVLQSHSFVEIGAMKTTFLTQGNDSKYWVDIFCEDGVFASSIEFSPEGVTSMDSYTVEPLVPNNLNNSFITDEAPIIDYKGNPDCSVVLMKYHACLRYAALASYLENDIQGFVIVGDGCPILNGCIGHPGNSHSQRTTFDIDYFTIDGSNSTQYGVNLVQIWDKIDPDDMVLNDKVDYQRLYSFITHLYNFSGGESLSILHIKIADLIQGWLSTTDWVEFNKMISVDTGINYNHHTHAHIKFNL